MSTCRRVVNNILRVAVVLKPTLVDPIDNLPTTTWDVCQDKANILYAISESLIASPMEEMYSLPKTRVVFVLLFRQEGADSCCCPAVDGNCKGYLYFIARVDEVSVIESPEGIGKLHELLFTE
jgi:hypothetical protein